MFAKSLFLFLAALTVPFLLLAEVKLPALFTDNMVLQQQSEVAVWGWAQKGASVAVIPSWSRKRHTTKADENGRWQLRIATPAAGGPYELTVSDGRPVTLKNILIGEVWICSGQSNMEMPMKGFRAQPVLGSNMAILKSANPSIRLYTVPRSSQLTPQEDSKPSAWKEAGPESVSGFSATAYHFGKLLHELLGVPVGLIHVSFSGSFAEAWMPADALKAFPEVKIPSVGDTIKAVSRTPTTLYNGMLHPVIGYGMRGVIWYQGESNYDNADLYAQLFPTLVKEWRSRWKIGEFPFYFAQIAPFTYEQFQPVNRTEKLNSAYLRDVQRKAAARIPNSGMAVLMDIGEKDNIHPANKEAGGQRLALLALARTYGLKGFGYQSPTIDSLTVNGSIANVHFGQAPNGLTSFGKPLQHFEIAGTNRVFYPAQARISGSRVAVSAPEVREPVAVRYAFRDFVVGDLFSNEGLPVSSFRTDEW
jgi:sialate O-acetylesterase